MRALPLALLIVGCAAGDAPDAMVVTSTRQDAAVGVSVYDAQTRPPDMAAVLDAAPPRPVDAAPVVDASSRDAAARPDAGPPDAAPVIDADPPPPDAARGCRPETCNGVDDDCDTRVDEDPVCGEFIERRCAITLGWADNLRGPRAASPTWSTCPAQPRQMGGDVRCTTTRRDGAYVRLDLDGDVDENDQLALGLSCEDLDFPEAAEWIEAHCAVFFGHADNNRGPDGAERWGACPQATDSDAVPRCTSSGFDGQIRSMRLAGDVDENDDLGVAWICRDPAQPERALSTQAAAEVQLAWSPNNAGAGDGATSWGFPCPGRNQLRVGRITVPQVCVSTAGDGRFHRLDFERDINDDDDLGIALKRR